MVKLTHPEEMTEAEFKAACEKLCTQIDTLVQGVNVGVIMVSLAAVLGRGVVIVEQTPQGRDELLSGIVEEIKHSIEHWDQHEPRETLN